MKAIGCILIAAALWGCGPSGPETDPALDLLGDVVRVVQLAEVEVEIWADEVEPLRPNLADVPAAVQLYEKPKPAMTEVQAIRKRAELLISSLPRRSSEEVLRELSLELDRANDAVSAYRGPRNHLLAMAEERASENR